MRWLQQTQPEESRQLESLSDSEMGTHLNHIETAPTVQRRWLSFGLVGASLIGVTAMLARHLPSYFDPPSRSGISRTEELQDFSDRPIVDPEIVSQADGANEATQFPSALATSENFNASVTGHQPATAEVVDTEKPIEVLGGELPELRYR